MQSINDIASRGALMHTVEIKSFVEYISYLEQYYNRNYIFRGIHNLNHRLIPKIGRVPYIQQCNGEGSFLLDELQDIESKAVDEFVKKAIPHVNLREASSWDQWTIAQHHGLPTRLLDWTENPMIAAYFATENANGDVAVYVTNREQFNMYYHSRMRMKLFCLHLITSIHELAHKRGFLQYIKIQLFHWMKR